MSGDDLAIFLFFLTCSVAFGLEAVKAETIARRVSFGAIALGCLLSGVFWAQVKTIWPSLTDKIAAIATNPVSWFVIGMFFLAVIAFHRPPQKRDIEKPQAFVGIPTPISVPAVETAPEPIKEDHPREFVDTTPEYLLGIRRQDHLTRIQTDRIINPYLGKWMKVTGTVAQIYDRITWLRIGEVVPGKTLSVILVVEPTWKARFHLLEMNKVISAIGKISDVSYSEVQLEDCELVD